MSGIKSASIWRRRTIAALVIACAVMDLFPRHGPPDFRYTGSDPAHVIWNLGWPVALVIYDPQSGIHFGPFLYVVIPVQIVVLSLIILVSFLQHRRKNALQR